MSIIMDNRLKSENLDKDEEVKKLQELVKKLEIQNEELRSERQAFLYGTAKENECVEKMGEEKAESETNNITNYKEENSSSEDSKKQSSSFKLKMTIEDSNNLSDDETWLFDSPKAKHQSEWLRKDLNDPSLIEVKKSLVKKLDEITSSPRYSSCHSLYSPSSSSGVLSPESPPSNKVETSPDLRPQSNLDFSSDTTPGEIDTRTFIRPKKRKPLIFDSMKKDTPPPTAPSTQSQNGSMEYLAQSAGSFGSEEEDRLSSASDGSYSSFRLTDVEDVNALARLQEESLKFPEHGQTDRSSGKVVNSRLPSLTRRLGGSDPRLLDIQKSPNNSRTSSPQPMYSYNKQGSNLQPKTPTRSSRLQTSQIKGSRLSTPSPVRIPFGPMQIPEFSPQSKSSEVPRPRQSSSSALPRPGSRLQASNPRLSKSPIKSRPQSDWREGCY